LSGYGNCVVLDHGDGDYTLYAHAEELLVSKGQVVGQGDVIGRVGETDSVKGPGLHFEIRKGADAVNPTTWLRKK
jgi:murein DD-endopeptidase MepM/ murein hydrolase activator NlpD